jgi:hypothetical protein
MTPVSQFLTVMAQSFEESDVDSKLAAFEELKEQISESDLAELLSAICSTKIDFWTRELLAEPIAELGGAEALPTLLAAYQQNFDAGHDNDGFSHTLTEIAWLNPEGTRAVLADLMQADDENTRNHAGWLLDFCDQPPIK